MIAIMQLSARRLWKDSTCYWKCIIQQIEGREKWKKRIQADLLRKPAGYFWRDRWQWHLRATMTHVRITQCGWADLIPGQHCANARPWRAEIQMSHDLLHNMTPCINWNQHIWKKPGRLHSHSVIFRCVWPSSSSTVLEVDVLPGYWEQRPPHWLPVASWSALCLASKDGGQSGQRGPQVVSVGTAAKKAPWLWVERHGLTPSHLFQQGFM